MNILAGPSFVAAALLVSTSLLAQRPSPQWSPDGSRLVFRSDRGVEMIPTLGGAPRLLIPHRPDLWIDAVWSADGRSLAYAAGDSVLVRPVEGGAAVAELFNYAWSENGRFIYYLGPDSVDRSTGIWRVPAAGGASRLVVRFDDPIRPWHRIGSCVRGGQFYFTLGDQQSDIWRTEVGDSR